MVGVTAPVHVRIGNHEPGHADRCERPAERRPGLLERHLAAQQPDPGVRGRAADRGLHHRAGGTQSFVSGRVARFRGAL